MYTMNISLSPEIQRQMTDQELKDYTLHTNELISAYSILFGQEDKCRQFYSEMSALQRDMDNTKTTLMGNLEIRAQMEGAVEVNFKALENYIKRMNDKYKEDKTNE